MTLLNPLAILFALLAVPIILLYLLRLKRREQTVSSTLLWRQALMDREANTLWQRLRRSLLLALQLLTLAFLVFALLRPSITVPWEASGPLIVLLDASASMAAADVSPSRFEAAKAQVRALIRRLGANDAMTILLVDGAPRALTGATADQAALLTALDEAQPSLQAAHWAAALALAAGAAGRDAPPLAIVSDGADANSAAGSPFQLLPDGSRFITVGIDGDNLAISALTLRRSTGGLAALVRVTNTGAQEREALVSLRADAQLVDARTLRIPAGQSAAWTVPDLPPDASAFQADLEAAEGNHLAIDDTAWAVNTTRRDRRALLLGPGNLFLEQALAALPELQATRIYTPPAAGEPLPDFDLYILDGITMPLPAGANALYILPALPQAVTVTGFFTATAHTRSEAHPVVESADWSGVSVARAGRLDAPAWLSPIVHSRGGPLLYAGEAPAGAAGSNPGALNQPAGRAVVVPFDLRDSDLPLQIAFPIVMANAVAWLAPPQGSAIPASIPPGEAVALPQDAQVQLPDGTTVTAGSRGFAATAQPGIYRSLYRGESTLFAVNFANPAESDITPGVVLPGGGAQPEADVPRVAEQEAWGWLAAAALAALMIEWWIYQRGLPFRRR